MTKVNPSHSEPIAYKLTRHTYVSVSVIYFSKVTNHAAFLLFI